MNQSRNKHTCIPTIIHQTYKSFETIPERWVHVPDSWKKNHPHWQYRFWSDNDIYNFIDSNYSDYSNFFRALPYHIQRVDMVRYFILYHYGGVYSDLDIESLKSIEPLFSFPLSVNQHNVGDNENNVGESDVNKNNSDENDANENNKNKIKGNKNTKTIDGDVYLIRSPNGRYITNMFMASKAGAKFWQEVINEIVNRITNNTEKWKVDKHLIVLNTTGPAMLDDVVQKTKQSVVLLPSAYFFPKECGINATKPCSTPDSFVKHLEGSSWVSPTAYALSRLYSKPYFGALCLLLFILLLAFILFIGYLLGRRFGNRNKDNGENNNIKNNDGDSKQ